jgi:hypothetical protein
MKYALVDANNIVQNLIVYSEGSNYTPEEGLSVQQVNEWINIGDNKDAPEPLPPEPLLEE